MAQRVFGGVRLLGSMGPSPRNIELLDRNCMPMVAFMQECGLQVDLSHFAKLGIQLTQDMDRITEDVRSMTGYYINIDSGDQVSDLLFKKLGLKQARPKMTPSGDRESVEDEVLKAIQHEHPVVGKIQDYKEYSKLRGTYVEPMPKLARRVAFGKWRMFPNFTTTRIPSGRFACVRKGTPIEVLRDSSKYPKGVPIEEVEPGDWAYTYDDNLNLTIRRVKAAWCSGIRPILRVHWIGTGKKHSGHLDVTPDHRIRLTTGEYRQAQDLNIGDSICSLARGRDAWGYSRLWATGIGEITKEHRFIYQELYGKEPEHVHHVDRNKANNHPDNLEGLTEKEHLTRHKDRVFSLKHRDNLRRAYYATGLGSKSPEERSAYQESHKLNLTKGWIEEELWKHRGMPTRVCKKHGIDYATFQKYCRLTGVDWKYIKRGVDLGYNHRVVKIEVLNEIDYVYDLEIEDTSNFIAGELCVHNCKDPNLLAMPTRTERGQDIRKGFITDPGWCYISVDFSQIEVRMAAHLSQDPALMAVYFNEEDVYSDFAIAAFKLPDKRFKNEKGKWEYPGVHKMDHRYPAKTCILASIYAVTAKGLLDQMPIICANCGLEAAKHTCHKFVSFWTEQKCQDLINAFYLKYPGVMRDRINYHQIMKQRAYIYDMWGRWMHTAAVRSVHQWIAEAALREGGNFPYQSGACGVLKVSMAHLFYDLEEMGLLTEVHPLLCIHDELVFECEERIAEEWAAHVKYRFQTAVQLTVPIKASVAPPASSWGHLLK